MPTYCKPDIPQRLTEDIVCVQPGEIPQGRGMRSLLESQYTSLWNLLALYK